MGWLRRLLVEGKDPQEQLGREAAEYLETGQVPQPKPKKTKKRKEKDG